MCVYVVIAEGERNKLIAVEVARNVELWRKAMEFILTKLASVSMYETTYNIPKEIVRYGMHCFTPARVL